MDIKVLLIDDEIDLSQNLCDFLEDYDFEVSTACNGEVGLSRVKEICPDIVIVDLNMPVMDGYEFTRQAKQLYPNLPIIVLSGVGKVADAMGAIRDGAWDFIGKPLFDMQVVLYTIEKCIEKARLIAENETHRNHLEELVVRRTFELEKTKKQIISCLGTAAEFKDMDTGFHVQRVAQMTYVIARGMAGLGAQFCSTIADASTMHDVGKIGIDDCVLLKKGKLNEKEWEQMQQHVCLGYSILSSGDEDEEGSVVSCSQEILSKALQNDSLDVINVAKRIALFHHERWDGKGYLFNLAEDEIPIEARIVSLVDFYDAVSSKRPYKEAFPEDKCQELINEGVGTQFDPAVVKAFFDNLDAIHRIRY